MDYIQWRAKENDTAQIYLRDYMNMANTKDLFGHKRLVQDLWKTPNCGGIVLTGPGGCGKHTAAAYTIEDIPAYRQQWRFLFLEGGELTAEFPEPTKCRDYLENLMEDASQGKEYVTNDDDPTTVDHLTCQGELYHLCIVIENPEQYRHWAVLRGLLYEAVTLSLSGDYPVKVFIILISKDTVELPGMMQRYMRTVELSLPSTLKRQKYLENMGKYAFSFVPMNELLTLTEGMSYGDLTNLMQNILAIGDTMTLEELKEFVLSQKPIPSEKIQTVYYGEALLQTLNHMSKDLTDSLVAVAKVLDESANRLEKSLPTLTEKLSHAVQAGTLGPSEDFMEGDRNTVGEVGGIDLTETEMADKIRADYESMLPKKGLLDCFGKELLRNQLPEFEELLNVE